MVQASVLRITSKMSPLSVICFGIAVSFVVFGDVTDAAPEPQYGGGFGGGGHGGGGFGRPGYGRPIGGFGREREGFGRSNGPNISISKSISISGGGRGGGSAISSAQSRSSGK